MLLLLLLLPFLLSAVAALAVICKYLQPQGVWCLLQGQGARQPAVLWLLYPLLALPTSWYGVAPCLDTTAFFNASPIERHVMPVVQVAGQHMIVLYHSI